MKSMARHQMRAPFLGNTMGSCETILECTGIPERDIRRALALLISSGLLGNVDREFSKAQKVNEANK